MADRRINPKLTSHQTQRSRERRFALTKSIRKQKRRDFIAIRRFTSTSTPPPPPPNNNENQNNKNLHFEITSIINNLNNNLNKKKNDTSTSTSTTDNRHLDEDDEDEEVEEVNFLLKQFSQKLSDADVDTKDLHHSSSQIILIPLYQTLNLLYSQHTLIILQILINLALCENCADLLVESELFQTILSVMKENSSTIINIDIIYHTLWLYGNLASTVNTETISSISAFMVELTERVSQTLSSISTVISGVHISTMDSTNANKLMDACGVGIWALNNVLRSGIQCADEDVSYYGPSSSISTTVGHTQEGASPSINTEHLLVRNVSLIFLQLLDLKSKVTTILGRTTSSNNLLYELSWLICQYLNRSNDISSVILSSGGSNNHTVIDGIIFLLNEYCNKLVSGAFDTHDQCLSNILPLLRSVGNVAANNPYFFLLKNDKELIGVLTKCLAMLLESDHSAEAAWVSGALMVDLGVQPHYSTEVNPYYQLSQLLNVLIRCVYFVTHDNIRVDYSSRYYSQYKTLSGLPYQSKIHLATESIWAIYNALSPVKLECCLENKFEVDYSYLLAMLGEVIYYKLDEKDTQSHILLRSFTKILKLDNEISGVISALTLLSSILVSLTEVEGDSHSECWYDVVMSLFGEEGIEDLLEGVCNRTVTNNNDPAQNRAAELAAHLIDDFFFNDDVDIGAATSGLNSHGEFEFSFQSDGVETGGFNFGLLEKQPANKNVGKGRGVNNQPSWMAQIKSSDIDKP